MRVLHVIPAVADRYGGPGVVAVETVRALRQAGHEAVIATTDANGDRRLALPVGRQIEWRGVPMVVCHLGGGERFKWSGALARWLSVHVASFDLVDIHAVFSHSSLAAAAACRRRGVPYVVRPHGSLDPWSLSRKPLQKRVLFSLGARRMLSEAAFVQYTTAAEQEGAERALPWLAAGSVVPLGVDDKYFATPCPDRHDPFVLALSRLEEKKSLELLIDAFHEAAGAGRWRLVLAGAGRPAYVEALRARALAGAAADRIQFAGWVEGAEKRRLLGAASLLASPSAQENFGLSIAEAMAGGVPVLVTPGVNLASDIEATGSGWIVSRDLPALTAALRDIMGDEAERQSRGRAAARLAGRFRWRESVGALVDLYTAALGPAARVAHG